MRGDREKGAERGREREREREREGEGEGKEKEARPRNTSLDGQFLRAYERRLSN